MNYALVSSKDQIGKMAEDKYRLLLRKVKLKSARATKLKTNSIVFLGSLDSSNPKTIYTLRQLWDSGANANGDHKMEILPIDGLGYREIPFGVETKTHYPGARFSARLCFYACRGSVYFVASNPKRIS